jgi:hypothetical protein
MNAERDKSSFPDFENLIRMNQNQTELLARLLADCFIDDPLTILQTENINNQKDFLTKLFRLQLDIYSKTRDVFLLDETCKSVLIGCERKRVKTFKEIILSIQASSMIKKQIDKAVFKAYANNLKIASKAIDLNWYKPFKIKNFYHINIIAIDKTDRGKGKFRALLTPIINFCERNNLSIILETANPKNVPLFEHSGFHLVKTIEDNQSGINQYCFIKHPGPLTKP